MNEKSNKLDLESTNFSNPHGLSNSNNLYFWIHILNKDSSTASNVGKLVYHAM